LVESAGGQVRMGHLEIAAAMALLPFGTTVR